MLPNFFLFSPVHVGGGRRELSRLSLAIKLYQHTGMGDRHLIAS